ncbi:hypothetical protein GGQ97_001693 [Sphingomonas kaistensis]|uniref:Uncharacterized protein n=1 Tax=Sphingomonas kaistensis TaxID=298708 RepID=A0A7X6BGX6_9SPHN|nr:hypothetical protein [Sphingomonas kaistensis]NJC05900.1 hypothetical protein [Sphingomonas kaistensis]
MARAIGNQGNWFARIEAPEFPELDGRSLPCVWDFWWTGKDRFSDRGFNADRVAFQALVDGLERERLAILRKRKKGTPGDVWQADGYVAVYEIADIEAGENLNFRFVKRICNLENK